jgi:hypothetical protein
MSLWCLRQLCPLLFLFSLSCGLLLSNGGSHRSVSLTYGRHGVPASLTYGRHGVSVSLTRDRHSVPVSLTYGRQLCVLGHFPLERLISVPFEMLALNPDGLGRDHLVCHGILIHLLHQLFVSCLFSVYVNCLATHHLTSCQLGEIPFPLARVDIALKRMLMLEYSAPLRLVLWHLSVEVFKGVWLVLDEAV